MANASDKKANTRGGVTHVPSAGAEGADGVCTGVDSGSANARGSASNGARRSSAGASGSSGCAAGCAGSVADSGCADGKPTSHTISAMHNTIAANAPS
jgi:hypothetical protein